MRIIQAWNYLQCTLSPVSEPFFAVDHPSQFPEGHAVCAMYFFTGAADVALETSGSAVVLGTSIPLLTESAWDAVAQLLQ